MFCAQVQKQTSDRKTSTRPGFRSCRVIQRISMQPINNRKSPVCVLFSWPNPQILTSKPESRSANAGVFSAVRAFDVVGIVGLLTITHTTFVLFNVVASRLMGRPTPITNQSPITNHYSPTLFANHQSKSRTHSPSTLKRSHVNIHPRPHLSNAPQMPCIRIS